MRLSGDLCLSEVNLVHKWQYWKKFGWLRKTFFSFFIDENISNNFVRRNNSFEDFCCLIKEVDSRSAYFDSDFCQSEADPTGSLSNRFQLSSCSHCYRQKFQIFGHTSHCCRQKSHWQMFSLMTKREVNRFKQSLPPPIISTATSSIFHLDYLYWWDNESSANTTRIINIIN